MIHWIYTRYTDILIKENEREKRKRERERERERERRDERGER